MITPVTSGQIDKTLELTGVRVQASECGVGVETVRVRTSERTIVYYLGVEFVRIRVFPVKNRVCRPGSTKSVSTWGLDSTRTSERE